MYVLFVGNYGEKGYCIECIENKLYILYTDMCKHINGISLCVHILYWYYI